MAISQSGPSSEKSGLRGTTNGVIEVAFELSNSTKISSTVIPGALVLSLSKYINDDDVVLGVRTVKSHDTSRAVPASVRSVTVQIKPHETILQYMRALSLKIKDSAKRGFIESENNASGPSVSSKHHAVANLEPCDSNQAWCKLRSDCSDNAARARIEIHHRLDPGKLYVLAHFDKNQMTPSQAELFLDVYQHVLYQLHSHTETQLLSSLTYTPASHKEKISSWNAEVPEAARLLIGERIDQHTLRQPGAPAICSWDGDLSYRELDALTTTLAKHLTQLKHTNDKFIAFCSEKSTWAIVIILAIQKAGSGFVFIDPANNKNRMSAIIKASKASIILVSPSYAQSFADYFETIVVVDKRTLEALPKLSSVTLPSVASSHAAYMINTSGSTGIPKSIIIEQSAMSTAVTFMAGQASFTPATRTLQYAGFTFDTHIHEIFTTLAYGGCVCVPSEDERMGDISVPISRMKVNVAELTPSVMQLLDPKDVPTLQYLTSGGEACTADLIERWADRVNFCNSYGPSECAVTTCFKSALKVDTDPNDIGKSNAARLWIVDPRDHNILSPIGCSGELLVEGPLLARGYTDDEETAKSFIVKPSWINPSNGQRSRFYKTGDLVKYKDDGSLHFLGRKDSQIKLNGRRLELGEVEHAVLRCAEIDCVVVQFLHDGLFGQQLVAVVALKSHRSISSGSKLVQVIDSENLLDAAKQIQQVKDKLRNRVPTYMIPHTWLAVKDIPLSVNRKLDRNAVKQFLKLQPVYKNHSDLLAVEREQESHTTPGAEVLPKLHSLYADALNMPISVIGPDSNFFELGGTSMKAMKLSFIARRDHLDISVPILFKHPVLKDLALQLHPKTVKNDSEVMCRFELVGGEDAAQNILLAHNYAHDISWNKVRDMYPCTPLQAGLLALSTINPGTYTSQNVFRIPRSIDLPRFRRAWERCVRETDILRAVVIPSDEDGFHQVIVDDELEWRSADTLDAYLASDRYDHISCGSKLNRFAVLENNHYFVWTAHHAAYDGFSVVLTLQKVEQIYNGLIVEETISIAPLVKFIRSYDQEKAESSWRSYLANVSPVQFPRQSALLPDAECSVEMSLTLNPRNDITLPTIIRAAWALVLNGYSESDDIIFGTTMSGRTAPIADIDRMAGPTITTVPVRIPVHPATNIQKWLQKLQQDYATLTEFDHVGLPTIASYGPECKLATSFNNLLIIQPAGVLDVNFLGMSAITDSKDILQEEQTYPLNLEVAMQDSSLKIKANHNLSLLAKPQMKRMLNQFCKAIRELLMASETTDISDISLVSSQDLEDILRWNITIPPAFETTIPEQFLLRVQEDPTAPAVCAWDGKMTYAELDNASFKLARHLASLGVGENVTVPVCFEKSIWAVVATLAIMRTGAAFVPVDATHPPGRVAGIIRKVAATILVTTPQQAQKFSSLNLVVVQVSAEICNALPNLLSIHLGRVLPLNPAFILFTSGSTGNPKGIIVEHQAVCTSTNAYGSKWNVTYGTRVFQFASYVFDVSVSDMFMSLTRGACVCVPSDHDRMNDTAAAINNLEANFVSMTPTVASVLNPEDVPLLRTMVLGGEGATLENIRTWSNKIDLFLCYGPAECAITCSSTEASSLDSDPSNLGFPLGANILLVDPADHNQLVPVGCVGEILIGGPVLARGYLSEPDHVQAAFIRDPDFARDWPHMTNSRFYKTGDLGIYNQKGDGSISFAGRKDNQVKIRGQRVELAEVEFHTHRNTTIHHAMATVPAAGPFKGRLVAVLTFEPKSDTFVHDSKSSGSPSDVMLESRLPQQKISSLIAAVKDNLLTNLPQYMVPSAFIPVENIPLNTSGKMNRRQVKTWVENLDDTLFQAINTATEVQVKDRPLTQTETLLRCVWSKVLRLQPENVKLGQSFLALGGDSIMAMMVVSRCHGQGVTLTVKDVLQSRTLEGLAAKATAIEEGAAPVKTNSSPAHTPVRNRVDLVFSDDRLRQNAAIHLGNCTIDDIEAAYPCTPVQNGMLVAHARDADFYEITNVFEVNAVQSGHMVDVARLEAAWLEVVKRQPVLRTVFFEEPDSDNVFHQAVLKNWPGRVALIHSTEHDPSETLYTTHTIDFTARRPPNMFTICTTDAQKVFVKVDILHTMSDGTTWDLIFKEINQAYEGNLPTTGAPSYATYVSYFEERRTPSTLTYWSNYLGLLKPCLFPKLSTLRSDQKTARMIDIEFHRTEEIKAFCAKNGITVSNMIQTAWALVLRIYMRRDDLCFGYVVSGRDALLPGIETAIGTYIAQLPSRVRIRDEHTIMDIARSLQDDYFNGMEHQHVSLMELHRALGITGQLFNTNVHYMRSEDSNSHIFSSLEFEYRKSIDPSEYDMTVHAMSSDRSITFHLGYWDSAVSETVANQVGDVLKSVLSKMLMDSSAPVESMQALEASAGREVASTEPVREALPFVNQAESQSSLTDREEQIRSIWVDILQVKTRSIKPESTFRSQGGDSYLSMLLIRKLREYGYALSYADALSDINLAQMASKLKDIDNQNDEHEAQTSIPPESSSFHDDHVGILIQAVQNDFPTLFPLQKCAKQDIELGGGQMEFHSAQSVADLQPATHIQSTMLTSQLNGESFYNSRIIWRIPDSLQHITVTSFKAAWQRVVDSHAILRTVFGKNQNNEFFQLVLHQSDARAEEISSYNDYEAIDVLSKQAPVDCRALRPPHRLSLCSTPKGFRFFSLTVSHALSDAVSLSVMIEELATICARKNNIIVERHPFRDLATSIPRRVRKEGESYWSKYLFNSDSTILRGSRRISGKPASLVIQLDRLAKLRSFATASGFTASSVFRLAWSQVLQHWSGESTVYFDYIVSGRDTLQPGIDKMVGPMLNILPCRVALGEGSSTEDLLKIVQSDFFDSLPFQRCLPSQLQSSQAIPTAKFNTLVNFRNNGVLRRRDTSVEVFEAVWSEDPMMYDIVLAVNEGTESLEVELNYWTEGLSAAVVSALGSKFVSVLDQILAK